MQYNNRRAASMARAIIKTTFAVLGMGAVVAFLSSDDTLQGAQWPLVGALVLTGIMASVGGLYELSLQGDNTFLDITCNPVLQTKGRSKTYSIQSGNVLSASHLNFLIAHILKVTYIGHHGKPKTARVGLTLMGSTSRDRLLGIVKKLADSSKQN